MTCVRYPNQALLLYSAQFSVTKSFFISEIGEIKNIQPIRFNFVLILDVLFLTPFINLIPLQLRDISQDREHQDHVTAQGRSINQPPYPTTLPKGIRSQISVNCSCSFTVDCNVDLMA